MDWTLCVICQNSRDTAPLSCPKNRQNRSADDVYKDFLDNVREFEKIGALPVDIDFGEHGTPESFAENNASWHRACHQKFNKSKLERELSRKRKQEEDEEAPETSASQRSSVSQRDQARTRVYSVMRVAPENCMNMQLNAQNTI